MSSISKALIGFAVFSSAIAASQAAVIFDMKEVGSDVVVTASGTVNLTGLNYIAWSTTWPLVDSAVLGVGTYSTNADLYRTPPGPVIGSASGSIFASSGLGDSFGFYSLSNFLYVPMGYVSGSPLAGSATWNNESFSTLGVTPGTYTLTWGSGTTADSMTLNIGSVAAVPEPSTMAMTLAGLGLLVASARRQRRQSGRSCLQVDATNDNTGPQPAAQALAKPSHSGR